MIRVEVKELLMTNVGFAVLLKGDGDPRSLPIFIGAPEAQAISIRVNNVETPRPLTHDLMRQLLQALGARLERVEICDLRDGTFYADLVLLSGGEEVHVDARPSDGIALALRSDAPIYVYRRVMEEAGRVIETSQSAEEDVSAEGAEKEKEPKDSAVDPLTKLKRDLETAISEERYEDAAVLRDEIQRRQDAHGGN